MLPFRQEVLAFNRTYEHLLSKKPTLTDDERSLVEYYVNDLSQEFMLNSFSTRAASKSAAQQSVPALMRLPPLPASPRRRQSRQSHSG